MEQNKPEKLPLRLYGEIGCPHCEAAIAYINALKVPLQIVAIVGDPVITEGLTKLYGEVKVPVVVSLETKEVISGYKAEEYERLAAHYNSKSSASTSDKAAAKGDDTRKTAKVGRKKASAA